MLLLMIKVESYIYGGFFTNEVRHIHEIGTACSKREEYIWAFALFTKRVFMLMKWAFTRTVLRDVLPVSLHVSQYTGGTVPVQGQTRIIFVSKFQFDLKIQRANRRQTNRHLWSTSSQSAALMGLRGCRRQGDKQASEQKTAITSAPETISLLDVGRDYGDS